METIYVSFRVPTPTPPLTFKHSDGLQPSRNALEGALAKASSAARRQPGQPCGWGRPALWMGEPQKNGETNAKRPMVQKGRFFSPYARLPCLSLPLLCCRRIALRCSSVLRNSCQASQANPCIKRIIDYQSR